VGLIKESNPDAEQAVARTNVGGPEASQKVLTQSPEGLKDKKNLFD